MQMKATLLLILWFPVFSVTLKAQLNYNRLDFEKINAAYSKYPDMSMELTYNLHANFTTSSVSAVEKAVSKRSGKKIWYKIAEVETLTNERYKIVADHEDKFVLIEPASANQMDFLMAFSLDTLLRLCKEVSLLSGDPGSKGYKMLIDLPEIERLDVYFDTGNFLIRKLILYYRQPQVVDYDDEKAVKQKPRMEILCRYTNLQAEFSSNTFSEEKYVRRQGGKFQLAPAYKDYLLLDNVSSAKR